MADNKLTDKDIEDFAAGKRICFKEASMELARRLIEAEQRIDDIESAAEDSRFD